MICPSAGDSGTALSFANSFQSDRTSPFAYIAGSFTAVKITATTTDNAATMTVSHNGGTATALTSGSASSAFTLVTTAGAATPDTLAIVVTSGSATKTYTIRVYRVASVSFGGASIADASWTVGEPVENGEHQWLDHGGFEDPNMIYDRDSEGIITGARHAVNDPYCLNLPGPPHRGGAGTPYCVGDEGTPKQSRLVARGALPEATGGGYEVTYTISGLPDGVILGVDRVLKGVPTAAGTFTVTYTATGALGSTASLTFTATVSD